MSSLTRRAMLSALAATAASTTLFGRAMAAGEISILSGGAAKAGLLAAIPSFESAAKVKIAADFAPMGRLTKSLGDGATPDVIVVTEEVLAEIGAKGWLLPDTATLVGKVGVGVAVNEAAPSPDISTPAAFKATLLAAKSIVMIDPNTGTSGKHLAKVFADLGIADALKPKLTFGAGGYVVEPVGRGEIELGLHQITEILPVKGVKLVGPLPAPLQKVTTYIAVLGAKAKDPATARKFLEHLKSSEVRASLAKVGFLADK
ncbi:MAG: molybdate ABC transporter substrate-binding protein [Hyphomicrobiaceae bacterium]